MYVFDGKRKNASPETTRDETQSSRGTTQILACANSCRQITVSTEPRYSQGSHGLLQRERRTVSNVLLSARDRTLCKSACNRLPTLSSHFITIIL